MRAREPVPEALRDAPFGYRAGMAEVGRGTLRGPSFRRMARGAYCSAGLEVDADLRVRAAREVLPPFALLTGQSAAWALGSRWWWPDVVEVAVPVGRRVRSRPGIVVRERRLSPADIVMTDLGPATSPARTAFDLARTVQLDPGDASRMNTAVALARQFDADTCAELTRAAGTTVAPSAAGIWVPTFATADTRSLIAAVSQVDATAPCTANGTGTAAICSGTTGSGCRAGRCSRSTPRSCAVRRRSSLGCTTWWRRRWTPAPRADAVEPAGGQVPSRDTPGPTRASRRSGGFSRR